MTRRFGALRRGLLLAVAVTAALLTVGLSAVGAFAPTERSSVDARLRLAGLAQAPDDIVIVAIDARSLDKLNRFPLPRRFHAQVIDRLRRAGARAIAYDVQFTDASGSPADDERLYFAVQDASRVVLATTEVDEQGNTKIFGADPRLLRESGARGASTNIIKDDDGVIRRWNYAVDGLTTLPVALQEVVGGTPIAPATLGSDRFYVDYRRPGSFRTVSFFDVRAGAIAGTTLTETFKDKVVFVGATAPSLNDVHAVSAGGGQMPGVEVLANAFDTVRRDAPLRAVPGWVGTLLAVALAFVGPFINLRFGPLRAFALTIVTAGAYAGLTQLAFGWGRVLPAVAPLAAIGLSAVGSIVVHYITEAFERQRVRDVFGRFVSDSIARKVMEDGDGDVRLASDRIECTVMFSDLRGFTTYSESHSPEEVVTVVNAYLSEMSAAILDHGGTLTAYLGDGIMALFGAPYTQDDHAELALAASREMLVRIRHFNDWMQETGRGEGFRMGIGLNSGPVMVGTVGSERRLEYTGIGDAVNIAARIEGMTKDVRRQLLVCETTKQRLQRNHPDLVFVEERPVRGRAATVRLWGLEADAPLAAPISPAAPSPSP
ncbi:hypothetical protein DSM112329_01256 [Paraconexibacter sp. AEG42_29]|uniref:Guanylate cyclase domain-containing protein n=1 Tax=Paraconexibacter sp. AEG42_29 TaxID=2997339 RepID=A0AAU7AS50_9ACTN